MKKLLLTMIALLSMTIAVAQQTSHIVQRGETFELIAKRYNIALSELLDANPDEEGCYVGMQIVIPNTNKNVGEISFLTPIELSKMEEADNYLKAGRYKKAASVYSKILKNSRSADAYYGRGISYYNRSKYKSAIEDLETAMYCSDCTDAIKTHCSELIGKAKKLRKEQHNRRNNFWGQLTGVVVGTAATAYVASEQAKMQNHYYQNTMPVSSVGGNDHLNRADQIIAQSNAKINQMRAQGTAQLNMMTQNAIIQVEQTKQRMDMAFKEEIKWRGEYTKNNGRQPTEYEVDQWYAANYPDLLESRIMARGKMFSESQEQDKKEKVAEDVRDKTDYKEKFENRYSSGKDCVRCLGSGQCQTCNGKGWYYSSYDLSKAVSCPNCDRNHNGICSHCHGTGKNP